MPQPFASPIGILIALVVLAASAPALARDDGRYAQSPLKQWFDSLTSGRGACCSDADGERTEYEMRGNAYWAPIDGVMTEVPADALLTVPNKVGHAMKWLSMSDGKRVFRCFLPGAGL